MRHPIVAMISLMLSACLANPTDLENGAMHTEDPTSPSGKADDHESRIPVLDRGDEMLLPLEAWRGRDGATLPIELAGTARVILAMDEGELTRVYFHPIRDESIRNDPEIEVWDGHAWTRREDHVELISSNRMYGTWAYSEETKKTLYSSEFLAHRAGRYRLSVTYLVPFAGEATLARENPSGYRWNSINEQSLCISQAAHCAVAMTPPDKGISVTTFEQCARTLTSWGGGSCADACLPGGGIGDLCEVLAETLSHTTFDGRYDQSDCLEPCHREELRNQTEEPTFYDHPLTNCMTACLRGPT